MISEERQQELAEKYNLVPVFTADKVDGSDVESVDWAAVVPVLDMLNYQTTVTDDMVARFKAAWEAADARGEVGGRVRAGLIAALSIPMVYPGDLAIDVPGGQFVPDSPLIASTYRPS